MNVTFEVGLVTVERGIEVKAIRLLIGGSTLRCDAGCQVDGVEVCHELHDCWHLISGKQGFKVGLNGGVYLDVDPEVADIFIEERDA